MHEFLISKLRNLAFAALLAPEVIDIVILYLTTTNFIDTSRPIATHTYTQTHRHTK
jgi:hypothetical protein